MKKLLMLSGVAQMCEIVQDAQRKGIYVIVTDYLSNSPAKKIADESLMFSIDDVDGIVDYCHNNRVDGVMNYCMDYGQKPYQQICEKLGLPCVGSKAQFDVMTNKDEFKKSCQQYGVDVIQDYELDENLRYSDVEAIEFPVILKPVDGRASRGITVCQTKEDLSIAVQNALKNSKRKKFVVEKYLRGYDEVCAKYVVCDGEPYLTSMADVYDCNTPSGERAYIGTQTYPSKHYSIFLKETDEKLRRMISGLGIKNGALSFTGFRDGETFRFFDPSFRMGGAQEWRLVATISGVDISGLLTNFALTGKMGHQRDVAKIDKKFSEKSSALLYFLVKEGKIGKIYGLEAAAMLPAVIGYHASHIEGDVITQAGTVDHVVVRFLLVCDDNEKLRDNILKIQNIVSITDEQGKDMCLPLFDARNLV